MWRVECKGCHVVGLQCLLDSFGMGLECLGYMSLQLVTCCRACEKLIQALMDTYQFLTHLPLSVQTTSGQQHPQACQLPLDKFEPPGTPFPSDIQHPQVSNAHQCQDAPLNPEVVFEGR